MATRRGTHALRRGFSIVEVMITSGVLGIGLAGLIRIHHSSVQGQSQSNGIAIGTRAAAQVIEQLSTQPVDELPACSGTPGCRANSSAFTGELSTAGSYPCTNWVANGGVTSVRTSASEEKNTFRVDTVVQDHPDGNNQPDAKLITVSVCWMDNTGVVREVQERRLVVPGI